MQPFAIPAQIWIAGLVFLRVGAVVMLIPGIGEGFVPPRIRLGLALLLSLCLGPIAQPALGALPPTAGELGGAAIKELLIGLMLGGLMRMMLSTLAVAGEIMSLQTTLAFAQTSNPFQAQPGAAISSFLTILGTTMIFATNLHHLFIAAIARSYTLFAPAHEVLVKDAATLAVRTAASCFALGVQLAAPVIVFSLVFQIATGLVGRVMPQFQIFFASTPLTLLLGLSIFALSLGGGMLLWLDRYGEFLRLFT
jgi:flagellar biosynthetic protein FliR